MFGSLVTHLATMTTIMLMISSSKTIHQAASMEMQVPMTTIQFSSQQQPVMGGYQFSLSDEQNQQEQDQFSQPMSGQGSMNFHQNIMSEEKQLLTHHPYSGFNQTFNTQSAPSNSMSSSQSNESAEIIYSQPLLLPEDFSPIGSYPQYYPQPNPTQPAPPPQTTTTTTTTTTTAGPKVYYYTNPYLNNTMASKIIASGQYQKQVQYLVGGDKSKTIVVTNLENERVMESSLPTRPPPPSSPPPPSPATTTPPAPLKYPEAPILYGKPDEEPPEVPYKEFPVHSLFSVPKIFPKPKWPKETSTLGESEDSSERQFKTRHCCRTGSRL